MALALSSLVLSACAEDSAPEDGRDDSFTTDGKLDGFSASPGEAAAVLQVVNTFSKAKLQSDVQLSAKAAENIVAVRIGDDETANTADDETFGSLAELDDVPFVGPTAFQKLLAYVNAHNLVASTGPRQWQSETIVNGGVYNWTIDEDGKPVISYRNQSAQTAFIRLGDGSELTLPPDAPSGVPQLGRDSTGTIHLFYRTGSSTMAVTKHVAYRNGQWVDHGTLPGDNFRFAQNSNGKMFALTSQTNNWVNSRYYTATLHTLAADGSETTEALWNMNFSQSDLDFEVGDDGYPVITSHHPASSIPGYVWEHARRGPSGWQTTKVLDSSDSNLVAATGGPNATVFLQLDRLTPFRQTGLSFAAGAAVPSLTVYYTQTLDAALDRDGTAHACLVKGTDLIWLQYDAAGTMTTSNLGSASWCSMKVDNAGTIHMLSSNGYIVNHWTY